MEGKTAVAIFAEESRDDALVTRYQHIFSLVGQAKIMTELLFERGRIYCYGHDGHIIYLLWSYCQLDVMRNLLGNYNSISIYVYIFTSAMSVVFGVVIDFWIVNGYNTKQV